MPVTIRNTDILFNNGTTQSTAAVVDTTAVLNATAAASTGAVGTYAFLRPANTTTYTEGSTLAGSTLRYQGALWYATTGEQLNQDGGAPAGTWRAMGRRQSLGGYPLSASGGAGTLWLRIS